MTLFTYYDFGKKKRIRIRKSYDKYSYIVTLLLYRFRDIQYFFWDRSKREFKEFCTRNIVKMRLLDDCVKELNNKIKNSDESTKKVLIKKAEEELHTIVEPLIDEMLQYEKDKQKSLDTLSKTETTQYSPFGLLKEL